MKKNTDTLKIEKSSGNVFEDLAVPDPDRHLAKVKLAEQINAILARKKLKQRDAAKLLGIDQPKVSALKCGKLDDFSVERLITLLNLLDRDVEIIVKTRPTRRKSLGRLKVGFAS